MNFTDEVVLLPGTAVRDTGVVTSPGGSVEGASSGANLYVQNDLDQPVTLHVDYSRDQGVTWREFDTGTVLTVPAAAADLFSSSKALLASYGRVRVRASCAAAPTQGGLLVALHVNRRT